MDKENGLIKLYFEGQSDTLTLAGVVVEIKQEEDFTGEGLQEISILASGNAGSCKTINLYNVAGGKWQELATADSHLPDREKEVDYFQLKNGKLSVLSSTDCCCICECLREKK